MYGCIQVLRTLDWELNVVTVSDMTRCVVSHVPVKVRKRVTELSEELIDFAQSAADPIWWLGQRRSSLALGAVSVSLDICGVGLPSFKQFVEIADEHIVHQQHIAFMDIYRASQPKPALVGAVRSSR